MWRYGVCNAMSRSGRQTICLHHWQLLITIDVVFVSAVWERLAAWLSAGPFDRCVLPPRTHNVNSINFWWWRSELIFCHSMFGKRMTRNLEAKTEPCWTNQLAFVHSKWSLQSSLCIFHWFSSFWGTFSFKTVQDEPQCGGAQRAHCSAKRKVEESGHVLWGFVWQTISLIQGPVWSTAWGTLDGALGGHITGHTMNHGTCTAKGSWLGTGCRQRGRFASKLNGTGTGHIHGARSRAMRASLSGRWVPERLNTKLSSWCSQCLAQRLWVFGGHSRIRNSALSQRLRAYYIQNSLGFAERKRPLPHTAKKTKEPPLRIWWSWALITFWASPTFFFAECRTKGEERN